MPKENDIILTSDEKVMVKGYAWSGNGRGITWVDVSAGKFDFLNFLKFFFLVFRDEIFPSLIFSLFYFAQNL